MQPFSYQLRMPPPRARGRLLFKQLFVFFEKLLFLQDAHSGLQKAVTHSRVTSYCQNGLPSDTCNTNTEASCLGSSWDGSTHFLHVKSVGTRTVKLLSTTTSTTPCHEVKIREIFWESYPDPGKPLPHKSDPLLGRTPLRACSRIRTRQPHFWDQSSRCQTHWQWICCSMRESWLVPALEIRRNWRDVFQQWW